MSDLSNKTVCFVDNGLFVDFSRRCAKAFKKAYYAGPFGGAFPRSTDFVVGQGFDEIERIRTPLEKADEVDLWVFLDIGHGSLQTFLEEHGGRVWGCRHGEEIELNRWAFKKHLRGLGLPVQPCWKIVGMEELRSFLREHKEVCYVKTSLTRGDFETFRVDSFSSVEPRLDELSYILGARKDSYEFVVEDAIEDAVEVGYDGFCVDGKFPEHSMMAFEVKEKGMIGVVKSETDLASPVKVVNDKLSATLQEYQYRGFISTEIRYSKDKKPFLIDPCCRLGTPSNELLQELFEGWPETLWHGAEGELVSPKVKARFGVLAMLHCEWAVENWLKVEYPRTLDSHVMLRFHTRIDGTDYVPPQVVGLPDVGAVVGVGSTLLEAVGECRERAEQIVGHQLSVDLEALEKGLDVAEKGESYGIKFGPVPTREQLRRVLKGA